MSKLYQVVVDAYEKMNRNQISLIILLYSFNQNTADKFFLKTNLKIRYLALQHFLRSCIEGLFAVSRCDSWCCATDI